MPKYEEEPGVYSTKKPRPESDRDTSKVRVNMAALEEANIDELFPSAVSNIAERWREMRPDDLRQFRECDVCGETRSTLDWNVDSETQRLEPIFDRCPEHPSISEDWVYEILHDIAEQLHESRFRTGE